MMHKLGWLKPEAVHQIQVIWAFGHLIGNSDMHRGNLSIVPTLPVQVAPVYDMLPTMFAPMQGGEIASVSFAPELPMPSRKQAWVQASAAAKTLWQRASNDARISKGFWALCAENFETLSRLMNLQGAD